MHNLKHIVKNMFYKFYFKGFTMLIKPLTQSNETKVYFKVALGSQGSAKVYSKPLTKDLFNTISKSLKSYRIYLSVQSDKSNNYKQLDYQWLDIQDADKVDDAQRELFTYSCKFYRDSNKLNKDSLSATIYIDKLPKNLMNKIQWQVSTSKSSDTNSDDLF